MKTLINVVSFGYKNGAPPLADLVFNVRFIDNPYHHEGLKHLTGEHASVQKFVFEQPCVHRFLPALRAMLSSAVGEFITRGGDNFETITIAFGCAGGKQRSVALSLWCANYLRTTFADRAQVLVTHRDITKQ